MGEVNVHIIHSPEERKEFVRHILRDLKALQFMLDKGWVESEVGRIGAELELNFVDRNTLRPAPIAMEVLKRCSRGCYTTEYARFNLEINTDPHVFKEKCLSKLKQELIEKLALVQKVADKFNAIVVLAGILPTIQKGDVSLDSLTPTNRYRSLFEVIQKKRGNRYEFNITGLDELVTRTNPIVFGGCLTSFQVHLQVSPEDAIDKYNWALMISGPVLAAATNSPVFLGKRLWHETRIALFKQTSDTRKPYANLKEEEARVSFGNGWVKNSIIEFFQDEVSRYRAFLATDVSENPMTLIKKGKIPKLKALSFHNGTIYHWNRVCYGITNGKPHLRIENRVLPAGPTMEDQIANAAFWLGLMNGLPKKYQEIHRKMDFGDAKNNFLKAAQMGLDVQFRWLKNKKVPAQELILKELLPIAREGLKLAKIDPYEAGHYLHIIEDRVKTGQTGSVWFLQSLNKLSDKAAKHEAIVAATADMIKKQGNDKPIHLWKLAKIKNSGKFSHLFSTVGHIMTTKPFLVKENDDVSLAFHIMNWKKIRHIPVENEEGKLVGLISPASLVEYMTKNFDNGSESYTAADIMLKKQDIVTATADMPLQKAVKLMIERNLSCLPVVENDKLLGVVTETDLLKVSDFLINKKAKKEENDD